MALQYAQGAVQWLSADAATSTYVVSGLTFQPKAIRFTIVGIGSASDAANQTSHWRVGIGFALSASNRRCMGSQSQDAAGTQVCTTGYYADAVAVTLTSTPARDGALDIQSFNSDGFTLIVDDASPVNVTVMWEAWGGSDLTEAEIIEISEPAATGSVSYECGFQPDVLMLVGVQGTGSAPAVERNDAAIMFGAVTGLGDDQFVFVANDDDASATSDTDRYAQLGECLAMMAVGGGNPSSVAVFTGWMMRGFTLNWTARATTGRKYLALAIRGGVWHARGTTIEGQTGSATSTATTTRAGVPFAPIGLSLVGISLAEPASVTSATEGKIGFGSASSASARMAMGVWSENGNATAAEINTVVDYDAALVLPSNAGALAEAIDVDAFLSNGYRLIVDTNGGVTTELIGVLAFGSARAPHNIEPWKGGSIGGGSSGVGRQVI